MSSPTAIVTFRWDGLTWAFPVRDVVEIASAREVTPVPGTGARIAGIVAWRGRSLPVILPRPLKAGARPPEVNSRFLVVRPGSPFAVPVDEAGRVAFPDRDDPDEPGRDEGTGPGVVRAIRRSGTTEIRILDADILVNHARGSGAVEGRD